MKSIRILSLLIVMFFAFTFSAQARVIYVKKAPPVVRVEKRTISKIKNGVWVKGHWRWKRGKYVWVTGRWVKPRRGFVYVPGKWVKRPRGWVLFDGHWKRI